MRQELTKEIHAALIIVDDGQIPRAICQSATLKNIFPENIDDVPIVRGGIRSVHDIYRSTRAAGGYAILNGKLAIFVVIDSYNNLFARRISLIDVPKAEASPAVFLHDAAN